MANTFLGIFMTKTNPDSLARVGYFIVRLDVIFMKVVHGLRL